MNSTLAPDYLDYQADLNALATVTAFDETSLWSLAFGRLLLRELDLLPNITALDLGCAEYHRARPRLRHRLPPV